MRLPLDESWWAWSDSGVSVLDDGRVGAELGEIRLTWGHGLGQESGLNIGTGLTEVRGRGETWQSIAHENYFDEQRLFLPESGDNFGNF